MKTRKLLAMALSLVVALVMAAPALADGADATSYKLTDEPVTLTLVRSDNSNQPMQLDNKVIAAIEEATGVTLEIEAIAGSDFTTKTEMLIATGSMPDIMYDCYYVSNYASTGIYPDFSQYMDTTMPNIKALFDEYPDMYRLCIDGALYQIPVMGRYVYRMGRSPQIRQDLLEETGLGTPTNFDELFDVLSAIKANHPDMYPIANRNGTGNLFTCYAYSFGAGDGVYYEPKTQQYQYGALSEEFITCLSWLSKCYSAGLLDPDYAVCTSTQWQERLSSGQSCFFFDNPSFATNFNATLATDSDTARFAPMEVPASGDIQRGLFYNRHDLGATVASADTQYPEIVAGFIDFLYSDYGCDLTNFGIEGETFEYNSDGEPEILDSAVADYMSASDPMRGFFGAYSLGKLGMARYIDEHDQDKFITEEAANWYNTWENWTFMDEPVLDPAFTSDESEELAELKTSVSDILTSNYDAFIMGQRDCAEWTQVQDQIRSDAERICEIYNAAAARTAVE